MEVATALAGLTVSWKPRPIRTQAVTAAARRSACRAMAASFCSKMARLETGSVATRASVPSSSCPARQAAPWPMVSSSMMSGKKLP